MSFIRKYEAFRKLIDFECTFDKEATVNAQEVIGKCARLIGCMDNAEVQPVKHGKWIDCTFYDPCEKSWEQEYEFKCSNCEHKIYNKPSDNNLFCGHCGARMDGDSE